MTATLILPPDAPRDEWLERRTHGVGSSDIAALVGYNPWTSPVAVWLTKTGRVPPGHDDGLNKSAKIGLRLEPFIAALFTEETGIRLEDGPAGLWGSGWMLVSPDRFGVDRLCVVELKMRSQRMAETWVEGQPPRDAFVQLQWQLGVLGRDEGWIACLVGGNDPRFWHVPFDRDLFDLLCEVGDRFWTVNVLGDTPPLPRGDDETARLLARMPVEKGSTAEIDAGLWAQWDRADKTAKAAEKEAKRIAEAIRLAAGPAETLTVGGDPVLTLKWQDGYEKKATVVKGGRVLRRKGRGRE